MANEIIPRPEYIKLLSFTAELFNITPDIISDYDTRNHNINNARKCMAHAMANVYNMIQEDICKLLADRHYTTVGNWIRQYQDNYTTDKNFRHKADQVMTFAKIHKQKTHEEICPFCKQQIIETV